VKRNPVLRSLFFPLLACLATLPVSCRQEGLTESGLNEYLDRKEAVFEEISVQMGYATWCLYSGEAPADLDSPRQSYRELFGDDSLLTVVDRAYSNRKNIEDDSLRRRVEIWRNMLVGGRVNLSEDILSLQTVLETSLAAADDSAQGRPGFEELEGMMLDLILLRNEKARSLGYDHYAQMALEISGIGYDWFHRIARKIDSATREPYRKLLAQMKSGEDKKIRFSDINRLLGEYQGTIQVPGVEADRMESLLKESAEHIGIPFDWLPLIVVVKELPPTVGGQGIAVHIPHDFRMVVRPDLPFGGWMHELGHGLQWIYTRVDSPILKGYEWIPGNICGAWAEGMGETMNRFTRNGEWLKRYTDLTEEDIAVRIDRRNLLAPVWLRYQLSSIMLEIEVYKDPYRPREEILESLEKKYLFLEGQIDQPIPLAVMIFVSYPVYSQNYLLADVISWQIHDVLEENFGPEYAFDPAVGEFLQKKLYEGGALHPWRERLVNATGREFDIEGYLRSFGL
jgi:hypothetical protein